MSAVPVKRSVVITAATPPSSAEITNTAIEMLPLLIPTASDMPGFTWTARIRRPSDVYFSIPQVASTQIQETATLTMSRVVNVTPPMVCGAVEIQVTSSPPAGPDPTIQVMRLGTAMVSPNDATKIASSAWVPAFFSTGR